MKRTLATLAGMALLALACGEGDTEEVTVGSDQGKVNISAGEDGAKITVEQDGKKIDINAGQDGAKVEVEAEDGTKTTVEATEEGATTTTTEKAGKPKRQVKGKGL